MKHLYDFLCYLLAMFYSLLAEVFSFYSVSVTLSRISLPYGNRVRYYFYKKKMRSVGRNVLFSWGTIFTTPDISIGNNVRFGPMNTIGLVDFGNDILTAQNVHLLSGNKQHGINRERLIREQPGFNKRVIVGNDIWIGVGAIIMADLSDGCIVAAGSVVTTKVSEYMITKGNPAKEFRER